MLNSSPRPKPLIVTSTLGAPSPRRFLTAFSATVLADRTKEISEQISRQLQTHQPQILELIGQPALKAYARLATQRTQVVPNAALRIDLSAVVLAHQPLYAALIGVNRQGNPLFKIEARKDQAGITRPFLVDKDFSSEDVARVLDNFAEAVADYIFVSALQPDGAGKPQINLIAPLRDETGATTAALVVKLHAEQLLTAAVGPPSSPPPTATWNRWSRPINSAPIFITV